MTPALIIAIIRDLAICGALGFIVARIYIDGRNSVKVSDIAAVQQQLIANAKQQQAWAAQAQAAEDHRAQDMASVTAAIGSNKRPLFVCHAPSGSAVPVAPAPAAGGDTGSRSVDAGAGADIRPAIAGFEAKFEAALADCRQVIAEWPQP